MSTYTTKFSINDTAYFVDSRELDIIPMTIIGIYITETPLPPSLISYHVRFVKDYAGSSKYNESNLMYLEEAKAKLAILLSERQVQISNLV